MPIPNDADIIDWLEKNRDIELRPNRMGDHLWELIIDGGWNSYEGDTIREVVRTAMVDQSKNMRKAKENCDRWKAKKALEGGENE